MYSCVVFEDGGGTGGDDNIVEDNELEKNHWEQPAENESTNGTTVIAEFIGCNEKSVIWTEAMERQYSFRQGTIYSLSTTESVLKSKQICGTVRSQRRKYMGGKKPAHAETEKGEGEGNLGDVGVEDMYSDEGWNDCEDLDDMDVVQGRYRKQQ